MKAMLVCGLLGSGKTTFIRNRVQHAGEKTVVLVNDFGSAGIDGEILSADGIEAVELPSGCVCCTLRFDLITTIRRIVNQFCPEHLLIEPSGVASPSGVLEALESEAVAPVSVIGIVDATEFSDLYQSGMYGRFFEDQIVRSDVILVNKADLAGEAKVREAMSLAGSINPRAVLFRTVNAQIPLPLFPQNPAAAAGAASESGPGRSPVDHLRFETLSLRLIGVVGLREFSEFFESLARGRYGSLARAKALINTDQGPRRFDSVFGRVETERFGRDIPDSRLVVIGDRLDRQGIEKAVKAIRPV